MISKLLAKNLPKSFKEQSIILKVAAWNLLHFRVKIQKLVNKNFFKGSAIEEFRVY